MRILLISDVHANWEALNAVLDDAGPVDGIWCAGDLVDYGTDPHRVVLWFRTHRVLCVSGNHDRHLLNIYRSGESAAVRGTDRFKWVHDNCGLLTQEDIAYLESLPMYLPLEADGVRFVLQHQMEEGAYAYRMPESLDEFDRFWRGRAPDPDRPGERRLIFGHTHRRCVHALGEGRAWLNPGSVSYRRPDDPDKRAHYMILDGGEPQFRAVPYDRGPSLARAMEYLRTGGMMPTELQDAMFFFGGALTSRDPLPEAAVQCEGET